MIAKPEIQVRAQPRDRLRHFGFALEKLFLRLSMPLNFGIYLIVEKLVPMRKATMLHFRLDDAIPFIPAWMWIYCMFLGVAFVPAFLINNIVVLRRAALGYAAIQLVAFCFFLLIPIRIVRPESALVHLHTSFPEWVAGFNYSVDLPVNCFPCLHVANTLFMALVVWRLDRTVGVAMIAAAGAIALSVLFVKQHFVIDAIAGAILGWAGYRIFFSSRVPPGGIGPRAARVVWLWIPGIYLLGALITFTLYETGFSYPWPPRYAVLPPE